VEKNDLKGLRTGFTTYLNTGKFSSDFVEDVNYLISKIYSQWTLYEDEEEFNSSCWAKIVSALRIYNEDSSTLATYLNWVVWNEATRIYSKHKKMSTEDITERLHVEPMWGSLSHHSSDQDLLHRDQICFFARKAFNMGIFLDQKELYRNYLLGNLSPAVRAFMWYSILQNKKYGINGVAKGNAN